MSLVFQNAESVKLALFEELNNLLSSDREVLRTAEERMKHLEYTEGYGVYLSELIMNQSCELPLRQIACIMLTRYVEQHWTNNNMGGGDAGTASEQAKRTIRNILPNGLYDTNSKIRSSVAHAISAIAATDWPTVWTDLFGIIVKCLGGNEDSIHGAMCILQEFSYDQDQIKELGPVIIPEVYRIFESEQVYSIRTRVSAILILKPLFQSINVNVKNKGEQKRMVASLLDTFWDKMMYYLSMNSGAHSNFLLRTSIVKLLVVLVGEMPKFVNAHIERALPVIWQLLTQTADTYVKVIVNATEPTPFSQEPDGDEDDDHTNFVAMLVQIFEFIQYICDERRMAKTISKVLADLIYIVIVYIQLTEEQLEAWLEDSETFVEEENENCSTDLTLRVAGFDVLMALTDETYEILEPLQEALRRHMTVAEAEKAGGNPHWWKIQEACMHAVYVFSHLIIKRQDAFDLANYLGFVRGLLSYTNCPFLVGRALVNLSNCVEAQLYDSQTVEEILVAMLQSLSPKQSVVMRIMATRSITSFVYGNIKASDEHRALVAAKLPGFLEGLIAIIPETKASVLTMVMEAMSVMTKFDAQFTAAAQDKIIPLAIAVYVKYPEDPVLLEVTNDLVKILLRNPLCVHNVQKRFLPVIMSIFSHEKGVVDASRHEWALEMLSIIVQHAETPLSDELMDGAFPAMLQCVLNTDDHSIMVAGGECLRAFVHVAAEQVGAYKNGEGLNYVMQLTTTLLNPMHNEMTAGQIGRLIITIIIKMGNMLGENVDLLLKAVISKMQLVECLRVIMSLVVVFAHLFLTQMEAVMNFLSTVPGPTGEPAMKFVFQNWLTRQDTFYGILERKVTIMALCKIFEYGVTTQDNRLTSITINETVAPSGDRVYTRSQSQANSVATTPALVKIFKILLNELQHQREINLADEESDSDDECDEGDECSGSEKVANKSSKSIYVSDLWDDEGDDDYVEDDQLNKELLKEPAFQINMLEHLTKFIREFSKNEHFPMFYNELNEGERMILQSVKE